MVWAVFFAALLLLAAGTVLNFRFGQETRQIVKKQFNDQQLVVARSIKFLLVREMSFLEKELLQAAGSLGNSGPEPEAVNQTLQPYLSRVMELGVTRLELYDGNEKLAYSLYPNRRQMVPGGSIGAFDDIRGGVQPGKNAVYVSPPLVNGSVIYLNLSAKPANPAFSRLCFKLNLSWFLNPLFKEVRSGKTGYAWLIDAQGRFLYHPQYDFIGQSAFEARKSRGPDISHHEIDHIQRNNMLQGMEGMGSYHSTWHLGYTGKIEKLIAYSPITVSQNPPQTWSVAVVAPVFEIEDAVSNIFRWQAVFQGLILLVIIAAGGAVLWTEISWSRKLEALVTARTSALKRSEENYRSLVESAEDFIFSLDGQGRLISVNTFTAAFFGSHPEELISFGADKLFTAEIADRMKKIVQTVFQKGKSVRDEFELKVDDSVTWLSANFMPIKDDAGLISAVLCIARDITENKTLERSLVNAEKLASLGTLAAGVAHEINNPLGVMLGFCDLLLRKKEPGSQEHDDLKIIERQGLHCKQIVENLLSFARINQETTMDSDINHCIEEIIKVVRHSLEMKNIDLKINLGEGLPRVAADEGQLQQVFMNLINNATAAMPDGGILEISTHLGAGGKKVAAQIRDQGCGIAPHIIDHIFEPFFTTKPEGEGTGLGLFVSYGIIQKYGGVITCESQVSPTRNKPRGTTFKIELPACKRK